MKRKYFLLGLLPFFALLLTAGIQQPGLTPTGVTAGTYSNAVVTVTANGVITSASSLSTDGLAPTNRTISTTGPLEGGGDLSANRTLSFNGATTYNASGATNMSASQLLSGTVPIARLGSSGTPSSATFLRGDNSWATAGGGTSSVITTNHIGTIAGHGSAHNWKEIIALTTVATNGMVHVNGRVGTDSTAIFYLRIRDSVTNANTVKVTGPFNPGGGGAVVEIGLHDTLSGTATRTYCIDASADAGGINFKDNWDNAGGPPITNALNITILQLP